MEAVFLIVGWIGIAGALILTLVILKEVALVVRELRAIHELAGHTREAARGLAANAAAARTLRSTHDPAHALAGAARQLEAIGASLDGKLDGLAGSAPRQEG